MRQAHSGTWDMIIHPTSTVRTRIKIAYGQPCHDSSNTAVTNSDFRQQTGVVGGRSRGVSFSIPAFRGPGWQSYRSVIIRLEERTGPKDLPESWHRTRQATP